MPRLSLSTKNIEFIKRNRLTMSGSDMAAKFGVEKSVVNRYMRKSGLAVSPELQRSFMVAAIRKKHCGKTTSTPEMDREIKKNYLLLPSKTLAAKLGKSDTFLRLRLKQLGLEIPRELIEQRKADSRLKPGNVPANKGKKMSKQMYDRCKATMFKKGNLPANAKEKDGVITVRHDHYNRNNSRPYKWIRVSLGKWQQYHQYRWEKFRGKIAPGQCLWFKDGDTMNVKLSNLECISRAENARRNRAAFLSLPPELQTTKHIINRINKKITSHEEQNKRSKRPLIHSARTAQ